ncbi:MAG: AAA family ATPase [Bacilli bacterium]
MLLMAGASASGKTEIAKIIIKKYGFKKMVTYTTRPMRDGEVDGVDYNFISFEDFREQECNNEFLETTTYNGNCYGTKFKDASFDKVLIVDTFGANSIYEKMPDDVTIFFLESPKEIRAKRMKERGDSECDIAKRLNGDDLYFNINNLVHVDYVIDSSEKKLEDLADEIFKLYNKKGTI